MNTHWLKFVLIRSVFALLALLAVVAGAVAQEKSGDSRNLVLLGGRVYVSPTAPPIDDAALLVRGGKVAAIGKRGEVDIPKSVQIIDCTSKVITAGFWNSHVHFTEDTWTDAATAPAPKLEAHMQEMLTR